MYRYFVFHTRHETRKTVCYTVFRFSIFVSRTKIENRYDKPFFVFRLTERKSKNKKRKTSGATVAHAYNVRCMRAARCSVAAAAAVTAMESRD